MIFLPAIKGYLLMLSAIVPIGPQNALLLRQAVRREQAWVTASIFLFGDVTMVLLGGFGIGRFLGRWPLAKLLLTALGALYILWFGVGVFRQMLHPKALAVNAASGASALLFLFSKERSIRSARFGERSRPNTENTASSVTIHELSLVLLRAIVENRR